MRTQLVIGLVAGLAACSGGGTDPTGTPGVTVQGVECDGDTCVVSGDITQDLTMTADKQWLLRGGVFIGDDTNETVLTVEPGTTVYGENSTAGMLVIRRGSRIEAAGTASEPIVFTSSKAPGSRARGDWGGLILNGRAPINNCTDSAAVCEQFGEGGTGFFGGDDANDTSGTLSYVRVEFAGTLISPDNELNGIGFQAVGRGTTIDHVQVHMNADDGVEFFGGTAEWTHLLITGVGDDMLDWTDGWQGKGQFFVGQQYEGSGDNGIEADNNAENNDLSPRSHPILSNITVIGSPDSASSDFGALLREGTEGELYNVVIAGFNEACLSMSQAATLDRIDAGDLVMKSSLLDCATSFLTDDDNGDVLDTDIQDFFEAQASNVVAAAGLTAPFDVASPDFRPAAGSAAASGGQAPSDAFFQAVSYRGGVDPSDDWTVGWTTADPN
ncbi:MAG: hypothetical protein H6738_21005 [Alphaproteobacteria bacterium]|nr:hypothetical protein [Alphaproteobacteria bacterium]MCB9699273.1 hypothetical protein [Alphaproteobacteria bacterium]